MTPNWSLSYAIRLLDGYPGGMGDLLKDRLTDSAMLLDALRRLCDGECVIDPTIALPPAHARGRQR